MRILFCNYEYPPLGGGGGIITALLAERLSKLNHEVTVLTSHMRGLKVEHYENGVNIVRVPVLFRNHEATASLLSMLTFIPLSIKVGKKLLRTNQYDIINTHFVLPSGPVGDVLSRYGSIPNVLSVHGGDLYDPRKFFSPHRHPLVRAWIRRLLRRADAVVGQSTNTLENMRRFYTPEIGGIRIPLGIKIPDVVPASRVQYGFGEDEVLLVTIGRFVARKAVDQLIPIMAGLRKEKVRLLMIGTGPQEQFLKQESVKMQLEDQIIFMGYVEEAEKFRILKMCDLYVSTSNHEGFGLAFLEAMACGLPVVCYDNGGQTDFLRDQETGYLVCLNDIDLFKERCKSLIRNPSLRKTMGEKNTCRVKEFSIGKCALRYESTFNNVLEANAKRKQQFL
jgi:glycosyltransferase involved in cell wall biosynthesis